MPSDENPILIVTGPPGVGKTTTVGILAARSSRAVHLEADAFDANRRQGGERVRRGGLSHDRRGIIIPGWFFEPLQDALHETGHPVAYAVLRAPLSACAERVRDREGGPLVESAVVEQLWKSFAGLGELERNVIDLEGKTRREAADLLERRLADGTLTVAT